MKLPKLLEEIPKLSGTVGTEVEVVKTVGEETEVVKTVGREGEVVSTTCQRRCRNCLDKRKSYSEVEPMPVAAVDAMVMFTNLFKQLDEQVGSLGL